MPLFDKIPYISTSMHPQYTKTSQNVQNDMKLKVRKAQAFGLRQFLAI